MPTYTYASNKHDIGYLTYRQYCKTQGRQSGWYEWYPDNTCTCSTGTEWISWNTTSTNGTSSLAYDLTWGSWNYARNHAVKEWVSPLVTEEERIARQERAVARQAELAELERQRVLKRATAKQRARDLLLEHLTDEQAQNLVDHQCFYVTSSTGKRFLINLGRQHNVFELNDEDQPIIEYCGHVGEHVPDEDNVLAQKLLIEHDVEHFIRVANRTHLAVVRAA